MSMSPARLFPRFGDRRLAVKQDKATDLVEPMHNGATIVAASELDDEALMQMLRDGDMDALGTLYERYAKLVFSLCVRILNDRNDSQDLVHEIFLELHRKSAVFDPQKGNARKWIVQLTYHRCFNWWKHEKLRHPNGNMSLEREADVPCASRCPDLADRIIWTPGVVAAFAELSPEQQKSLKLYYLRDYKFKEIAVRLNCSPGNAKNHVYRGLEHLRQILFGSGAQNESNGPGTKSKEGRS